MTRDHEVFYFRYSVISQSLFIITNTRPDPINILGAKSELHGGTVVYNEYHIAFRLYAEIHSTAQELPGTDSPDWLLSVVNS